MGLRNLLLGRRRGVGDGQWRTLNHRLTTLTGPAGNVGDEAQVQPAGAYQASFGCGNGLGSQITVMTYVAYARDGGGFLIFARYDYTCEDDPDWGGHTGFMPDPAGEVFGSEQDADAAAAEWGAQMAAGLPDAMGDLPGVFDWDGEPFDPPED